MIEREKEHWTVDKRIPIALILTIALQSATGIWWAATIQASNDELRQKVAALEAIRLAERMAVLEAQMVNVNATLTRVDTYLRASVAVKQP